MRQQLPLFSIVIPTYRRPGNLADCLRSLTRCDYLRNRFEAIVVDDGSGAPPEAMVAKFRDQFEVRLLVQPHAGPATARNTGAAQAKGEFLAFIDDDCAPDTGWLHHGLHLTYAPEAVVYHSHALTLPTFLRQHFNYGRGAFYYHQARARRGQGGIKIEPLLFYLGLLGRPFSHAWGWRAPWLAALCVASQGVNAAGFWWEQAKQRIDGTGIFEQVGPLDEAMLNSKEQVDFCLTITQAGGTIYFEPASVVTYVPGPPLEWADIPFYMLRWSDEWELASLRRLRDKWGLTEDRYFRIRYRSRGWRRKMSLIRPLSRSLTFGRYRLVERPLVAMDRVLNRCVTLCYAWRQARRARDQAPS